MLETFKHAVVTGSRFDSSRQAEQYRQAYATTGDPRDRELAHIHGCLARGKKLISINKAMQLGGGRPNGEPVLAIANAAAKWAWFDYDAGRSRGDDGGHLMCAFVSDYRTNPRWKALRSDRSTKESVMRFTRDFFPIRPQGNIRARVPIVPVQLRPRGNLKRYHILWEANWQSAPVDPLLLKRVSREFFVIVAEWDLTEIERLVVEMAAFAGD